MKFKAVNYHSLGLALVELRIRSNTQTFPLIKAPHEIVTHKRRETFAHETFLTPDSVVNLGGSAEKGLTLEAMFGVGILDDVALENLVLSIEHTEGFSETPIPRPTIFD